MSATTGGAGGTIGRKQAPIWDEVKVYNLPPDHPFKVKKRATCTHCNADMIGKVERVRDHLSGCKVKTFISYFLNLNIEKSIICLYISIYYNIYEYFLKYILKNTSRF